MQLTSRLAGKKSCATRTPFAELATDFPRQALSGSVPGAPRLGREALMDATHPIWRTPAVRQAAEAGQFGVLIRMTRTARRLTFVQTATMLLTTTALDLGADSGDPAPELLATYGSLLCTASYTAAQNGNRSNALELITEAEITATRLGTARVPRSVFSPTNVAIYQIGVHTALGDAGTALDYARKIDLRSVPTPERQARFCLDTARAWHRFGSPSNCFHALQAADRCAPEELRRSSVRSLVVSLVEAPGPTPSGLREFAVHCGAVV